MSISMQEQNYQYYMKADVGKYTGQWIAILEHSILAHGESLKDVVAHAQLAAKGKKFLLAKIPAEETMIF